MSIHEPGADELEVRGRLRELLGETPAPEPEPTAIPAVPKQRPRDWLDDILDTPAAPEPEPIEETPDVPEPGPPAKPPQPRPKKPRHPAKRPRRKHHRPAEPRTAWDTRPRSPRQSLIEAWGRVPYRLKWLLFHATAVIPGWRLGWVAWATNTAAWFAAGHWTTTSAFVLYGLAVVLLAAYRRTRRWAWPAAWAAAIPASSAVVGVLLYGTDYMNLRIPW